MLNTLAQRSAAFALLALVFTSGCTGHVEIPREQFEAATHDDYLSHRIRTKRGGEYVVQRFAFTDSTLVISTLSPADARYRGARLPIILPRSDVESVAGVKSNGWVPIVVVGFTATMIALLVVWGNGGFN
ncbi:MAG TPA: hypothetical protein VFH88_10260 [Candidatus Krumholzibacteria bacterium]|nr:hypothetical protein [Candidatus Krumholzibacteria bacterium]